MNAFHFAYNYLVSVLAWLILPAIWHREKRHPVRRAALIQRLGYESDSSSHGSTGGRRPRIWIHAVSVGEVKAAEAIVTVLEREKVQASILLTTTTTTGQAYARRQFAGRAMVRYAPLDLWWAVGRFLSTYQPDLFVCMETEIWPNWITKSYSAGIKTVFLNGRISARSIRSYQRIRPLIKPVLEKVEAFSMISMADARRIMALGAPARRIQVNGNVKMDARDMDADESAIEDLKRLFVVENQTPVFVAGSVRGAEAEMLIDVYLRLAAQIPNLVFILAPRHVEKSARIASLASARGITWQHRSELGIAGRSRHAPLVILDTIGELRTVYGLASVAFCGASLVPLGGQNVLEPAAWGKPVLFGPFMDDFAEAKTLLETVGGGKCVNDTAELVDQAAYLLRHPHAALQRGFLAKKAVLSNRGAARRHARVIADLLTLPPA